MARDENDENPRIRTVDTSFLVQNQTFEANGTNNVTISNVAPALVGTATIAQWLKVKGEDNTTYFIPCWT